PVWRDDDVNTEENQDTANQHAADSCLSSCFHDIAAAAPENCAQHATAIKRVTRKKIEEREQQIARRNQEEYNHCCFVVANGGDLCAGESEQGKKKAGRRTG